MMCAYLHETCFWVAHAITQQHANLNLSPLDCFGNARLAAVDLNSIFKSYDFSSSSVKTYGQFRIQSKTIALTPEIHQQTYHYSNWGMVRHLGVNVFEEALTATGMSPCEIERCLLVVEGFKDCYDTSGGGNRSLPEPTQEQLSAIASYFNQHRPNSQSSINLDEILPLLQTCVTTARQHKILKVTSFDSEENWLENFADENVDTLVFSDLKEEIQTVLLNRFLTLSPLHQTMLTAYYGYKMKQKDVAKLVGKPQYTVSRHLNSSKKKLLKGVTQWSRNRLQLQYGDEQVNETEVAIEEWLETFLVAA